MRVAPLLARSRRARSRTPVSRPLRRCDRRRISWASRGGRPSARSGSSRRARLARELDVARNTVTAAEAARCGRASRLASANGRWAHAIIARHSPASWRAAVPRRRHRVPGAELFRIIDPSSMRLEASVPSEDLSGLRVGADVDFTVRGYDRSFTGRIERIAPQADSTTRQVPIYVAIPERWWPAGGGTLRRGAGGRSSATGLIVPLNAVNTSDAEPWVLRVRERHDRARAGDAGTARSAARAGADRVRAECRRHAAARRRAGHQPGDAGEGARPRVNSKMKPVCILHYAMFISDTAIKRPVLTIVAMLLFVVFGLVALVQLDTDEFPEIDAPVVVDRDPVSRRVA